MNQDISSRVTDSDPDDEPTPFTLEFPTHGITSITYSRTRQVRQFEPERVEATMAVRPDYALTPASAHAAFTDLKAFVEEALGLRPLTPTPAPPKARDGSEDDLPF